MEPHVIKAQLLLARRPPQAIADDLDVSRSVVSHVIHGRKTSLRVASEIAKAINSKPAAIWPTLYGVKIARKARTRHTVKRVCRAAGG